MLIREARFSDYRNIMFLIKRNNLKFCSEENWQNLWINNPVFNKDRTAIGWVAVDANKIIGFFGTFPMQYHYNNKTFIAAASHLFAVDQEYRQLSIQLVMKFFNQKNIDLFLMTTVGHQAVYELFRVFKAQEIPYKNYKKSLFIILKFDNLITYLKNTDDSFWYILPNRILYYLGKIFLSRRINYWDRIRYEKSRLIHTFDHRFDILWEKYLENHPDILCFNRSQKSLKWHYNHLIKESGWVYIHETEDVMDGYIICVEDTNRNLKKINAVDLVVNSERPANIHLSLLLSSIHEAKKRGYDVFEFIGFNEGIREQFIQMKPFKRNFSICPYLYKTNNKDLELPLKDAKHWSPSMIDGDASI